jgi:RNA polymerase sigma-70 factor (ECF subfamily)
VITVSEPSSLKAGLGAHAPRCYTYFLRMGLGADAAADLTQETLLRALQSAHRFPAGVGTGVWILGIARNVGREHARRHRRELPDHDAATHDRAAAPAPDPAAVAERLDVERVLARLDPAEREVLVLRFSLDLPGEEVAELLGIGHAALRKRVARAKAHFERLWDQRGAERVP